MALVYQETRAEAVCSLEQDVLVLLNDKSRMKGDLHVRFREKFEVKVLLLTRLRGERKSPLLDLISGGSQGLSPTYERAHVGLDLLTLASCYITET